jgi:hypothetical protein
VAILLYWRAGLQCWGRQRLTRDIDITLFTSFGDEGKFVDSLLDRYKGRVSDAKDFAHKNRVLLLETKNGIGIDISLGGLPYENELVERANYQRYAGGILLKTCTAEDLITLKAFASRSQDWVDIETVIIKQQELDWDYIIENLTALTELLHSRDALKQLQVLKDRFYQK